MNSQTIASEWPWARGREQGFAMGLAATAFVLCYANVFRVLVIQWWSNSMYSYAFLVPLISGYVVWSTRDRIAASIAGPSYRAGLPLIVGGLAMLVAGSAGAVVALEQLSILPTLAGLILLAGGATLLRALIFPLAYLLFMIPIWDVITSRMHPPFQMMSAGIGETLMRLIGIPVYRTATTIELPTITLEVAEACSGVNYLIAITAVAFPYAHLSLGSPFRRFAVIAFAVGVAILSNGLRVALIGAAQYWGLTPDLHGPGHVFHGMVVALVGYAALFVGARFAGDSLPRLVESSAPPAPAVAPATGTRTARAALMIATALLLGAMAISWAGTKPVAAALDVRALPNQVGEWIATGGDFGPPFPVRVTTADSELTRTYRSGHGDTIRLYVGYFATQAQGRELVGHSAAFPVRSVSPVALDVSAGRREDVGSMSLEKGRRLLFWYDVDGRITADPYHVKALTIWRSVVGRRSNGAFVAVLYDPPAGARADGSDPALESFATAIVPGVQRYLAPTH